ncbi:MAG TPA: PIF1 family ATP-dependent DNA helicase [Saprospiraceae bacterium]|nr:PIF1 family ATP-dependent DNA helicase [Saprospiraceae bacterium]
MLDKEPLELSADFKTALDLIEKEGLNLFITGRAGTGKSTLLELLRNTSKKKMVVLAPTGIAALNVGGQTIHSFFGFPPKPLQKRDIKKRRNRRLYKKMELLVIDEISMVRADLLDNIDYFLRINRDNPLPFGGVQVVFFGDLFQLPPVVASEVEAMQFQMFYDSPYFFSSNVMEDSFEMQMLELRKVYRQDSRHFLRLLEAVRLNRIDYEDLDELNERYLPSFSSEEFYITLTARNATANRINRKALDALHTEEQTYLATVSGFFKENLYPTEAALRLKLEAQVMFIKNDPEKRFVNGTIGRIKDLKTDTIVVEVEEKSGFRRSIEVEKMDWEVLKYQSDADKPEKITTEVLGTFTQFPLKLAWAITIHKSQGKTFEKVIIDMGRGAFEHGQTYVALSRCRTLEGIVLNQKLQFRDVKIDERIVDFYEQQQ